MPSEDSSREFTYLNCIAFSRAAPQAARVGKRPPVRVGPHASGAGRTQRSSSRIDGYSWGLVGCMRTHICTCSRSCVANEGRKAVIQ
ncbi:MAG: hypothetical protein LUQ59_01700 [Methanothrix sp.]|nr:hypothetical protein [Methanothrix sp.]